MYRLVVVGVVIFLIIAFWWIFRKRLKPGEVNLIKLLLLVSFVVLAIFLAAFFKENGEGNLFTDRHEGVPEVEELKGDVVVITVTGDLVSIGSTEYGYYGDAAAILSEAASRNKSFKLVDDYAKASAYEGIKDMLRGFGVNDEDIEEVTKP